MGTAIRSMRRALASNRNKSLYGLASLSPANYLATSGNNGEAGVAAGFGIATLFYLPTLVGVASNAPLADRSLGAAGWVQYTGSGNVLVFGSANGSAGFVSSPSRTFVPSDVGKVFLHIGLHTGAANLLRAYIERQELGAGIAIVGYTAAATVHQLARSGQFGTNATPCVILSHVAFRGVPTLAQIQAYFDAARALGDLPDAIAGATVTHRWSAKDELARVSNPVGRKAYGPTRFSDTAYLSTAGSSLPGVSTGFWCAHYHVPTANSGGSGNGILIGRRTESPSAGWEVYVGASGATLIFYITNGTPSQISVSYSITAADVGRPMLFLVMFDSALQKARMIVNRTEMTQQACVGYTPASGIPLRLGRHAVDAVTANGADKTSWLGSSGGHASLTAGEIATLFDDVERTGRIASVPGKTDHLWDPTLDIIANALAMPTTIADRVGTDTLTRTSTLEVASYTDTAPPAPAQLTDRTTLAGGDALLRIGAPSVRILDSMIDGRRTLGAQGFSTNNYLQCAASGGVRGLASGFWLHVFVRPDSSAGLAGLAFAGSGSSGYQLYWALSSGTVSFNVVGSTNVTITSVGSTVTASDFGQLQQVQAVYDGATLSLYYKRQLVATGAVSGYTANAIGMSLFAAGNGSIPTTNASLFGFQGGDGYAPTLAELQQAYDDTAASGRIQPIPGTFGGSTPKTQHRYDLTTDILASGVDAVPATVLDRVGTDHLTKLGYGVQTGPNSIRGVGPYGLSDAWQSTIGGGIQGSATAWHVVLDLVFSKIPSASETIASAFPGTPATGWYFTNNVGGTLSLFVGTNAGASATSAAYTVLAGDLGQRKRVVMQWTGSQLQLWVNGVQAGANVALASFVPIFTAPFRVGGALGVNTFTSGSIECVQGDNANFLTPAEIATLNADLTLPPPIIAGKTPKRWRFEQDIAALSGALPPRSVERVSGAVADELVRSGSGLTLAQRTERLWSYEASPIINAAKAFTAADYFSHATALRGHAAGFWVGMLVRIDAQQAPSGSRLPMSCIDAPALVLGWCFTFTNINSTLVFSIANAAGSTVGSPAYVVAAADVGKWIFAVGVFDAGAQKVRLYVKRAEQGAGSTVVGYMPSTAALTVGRDPRASVFAAQDLTIAGWCGGVGIPSTAEILAAHDAVLAQEDIVGIPGKTDVLVSLKQDIAANGGAIPATLTDRAGSASFSRNGAPTIAQVFARAAGW